MKVFGKSNWLKTFYSSLSERFWQGLLYETVWLANSLKAFKKVKFLEVVVSKASFVKTFVKREPLERLFRPSSIIPESRWKMQQITQNHWGYLLIFWRKKNVCLFHSFNKLHAQNQQKVKSVERTDCQQYLWCPMLLFLR